MVDEVNMNNVCSTPSCGKPAKLKCPTCIKLKLNDSFFCSQECFKENWPMHKIIHLIPTAKKGDDDEGDEKEYDPWPTYKFSGTLRPFRQGVQRCVPLGIPRPDYALHPNGTSLEERAAKRDTPKILNGEEIEAMKVVCRLAREVLDECAALCAPGVTTDELDRIVHEAAIERECYPSPLGYYRFPKSVCTSVNEVICHGIPDLRPLENGDICNVDVTVYHRGFHGDLNETLLVGDQVDEESKKLVAVTYECIEEAIKIVHPGVKFREVGNVIQKHANANGFSVVKTYCGHGINRLFHTAPNVPHYAKNKAVGVMKAGNTFTIEPMINAGSYHDQQWPDGWTAVTVDGKRSAQFEQTLLVTETGCEVLTARPCGHPWFMDQLKNS
ncbi:unnamed protein product [Anisakis simplex]|uniref:Methionine aminopeptidase n=1 Tax=Anisakis simplex TaxID=6269 RepID=A0A0M3K163_ANISI|nr:unnamed protein product [Anisakis simplex]